MPTRSTDPLVIGHVIGDVLDPFTSCVSLRVLYNNCPEVMNCCELKPSQIVNPPRVEVGGDDLRTFYTLVYIISYSISSMVLYRISFYVFVCSELEYNKLYIVSFIASCT